jgi:hypothetical protein
MVNKMVFSLNFSSLSERDVAIKRIFQGFYIYRFGMGPLHYHSSCSYFDFEIAEMIVFENRLPASVSRGVDKNACSIVKGTWQ